MLNFFNEAGRIAMESDGVTGGYMLACELYWHIVPQEARKRPRQLSRSRLN
jgi:hypothetical protein